MNRLETVLRQTGALLDRLGFPWALIGALAVSARAEPRFTRDVDLAVALADEGQAEALVRDFRAAGYELMAAVEQESLDRFATARLLAPGESEVGIVVDLLFASSGIESEIVAASQKLEVMPGLSIPVAQTGHLIALKVLSRDDEKRPQDLVDLRALLAQAHAGDLEVAREAVQQVTSRGFHRQRDLGSLLEEMIGS